MSQTRRAEIIRSFRRSCTNVIGFHDLLDNSDFLKSRPVTFMQYRAHIIGSGLTIADLIRHNDDALFEHCPSKQRQMDHLRQQANEIQMLATMLDGDGESVLIEKIHRLACNCARLFN